MSVIADVFKLIGKLLVCLFEGEKALLNGLAVIVVKCPGFFSFYIEVSFVLLIFMGYMLMKRREQRMMPVPPPQMTIAPAPAEPCPPDYTLQKAAAACIGILIVVLVLFSSGN